MKIQNVLLLLIIVPALSCTTWQVQSDPVPNSLARLANQRVQVVVMGQGTVELEQATIIDGRVTGVRSDTGAHYSIAIDSVASVRARRIGDNRGARVLLSFVVIPLAVLVMLVSASQI